MKKCPGCGSEGCTMCDDQSGTLLLDGAMDPGYIAAWNLYQREAIEGPDET